MTPLSAAWDRLSVDGEVGPGYVRLRLGSVLACPTYAARGLRDGLEALVLEPQTSSLPATLELIDARGVRMHSDVLTPGRSGQTRLVLSLAVGTYREVFRTLCEDLVQKLTEADTEKSAISLFAGRLAHWQRFLREHGAGGLSREERLGLAAELHILQDHLLSQVGCSRAVEAWRGCFGENHDFQFSRGSVEVKASSANTPHAFKVSNVNQLEPPPMGSLFLSFVLVSEEPAGGLSLPSLVDSLRRSLDDVSRPVLDDRLASAGYLDAAAHLYATPCYSFRATRFYRVDEAFPRLRERDLPIGVETVQYAVALAACAPFEVAEGVAWSQVVQGGAAGG